MIPNILSIAGSDPSGGAGIQADIKAISAQGAYAMAAITALTAQNTRGVEGVEVVPPAFLAAQLDAVFADIRVEAVKIGMVATADIAEEIAAALARHQARNVVLDPVMIAKGGDRLLAEDATDALREVLLPRAGILTPNLPEAAALLGTSSILRREEMPEAARALRALGPRAVLLKGGHLEGPDSPDLLSTDQGETWLEGARVATSNTHGTGCTLSSALAARLALAGGDAVEAARRAKAYLARALAGADSLQVGHGHGPLHHFHGLLAPEAPDP
ncbi:MAG: bifunctional hydroxymethylpyrimidine kinase/phosphomethylpyrimidine kinase [Pseudomonadota bacterium]